MHTVDLSAEQKDQMIMFRVRVLLEFFRKHFGGEGSDEEHRFWTELRKELLLVFKVAESSSLFEEPFMKHIAAKFKDLSKLENIDAQIFYRQQNVRLDSANYQRVQALAHIPKLI